MVWRGTTVTKYSGRSGAGSRTALVGVLASVLAVGGCGNAIIIEDVGDTAISADEAGEPVIVVGLCAESTPDVLLFTRKPGSARPGRQLELVGRWTTKRPTQGIVRLDPLAPGPRWSTRRDPPPDFADADLSVETYVTDVEDGTAGTASASPGETSDLRSDQVLARDGGAVDVDTLLDRC